MRSSASLLSVVGEAGADEERRFAVDDSDEEVEEEFGISGDLDEEEEAALNPYRAAYEAGYSRAEKEDGEGEG